MTKNDDVDQVKRGRSANGDNAATATASASAASGVVEPTAEESYAANLKHVRSIIGEVPTAMLTTVDWSGQLRSRPMAIQLVEGDERLYLLTSEDSGKVLAIRTDHNVNVVCADAGASRFLSVCGSAQISQDRQKVKDLWNPMMKAWFPNGPDSPDICLIVIEMEEAEFWDAPNGKWVQLFKIAKAALSGRRYEASPSEHGEVHIVSKH